MTQDTLGDGQTTLTDWATVVSASVLKQCPICSKPVDHIPSEDCDPAATARDTPAKQEVRAR